jgi:ATP-dependent DNA helicase RecQ
VLAGEIVVLIATVAFGMGVNVPSIRFVIHIGLPANLSTWIQDLGRAGMDGDLATAILYVSEQEDLRQILVWTSEKKDAEVDAIHSNFKSVLVYFYLLHEGLCHENYVNDYFDIRGGTVNSDACDCPGCIYRKSKESSSLFRKILGAVDMLAMVCDKVTEVNIRLF